MSNIDRSITKYNRYRYTYYDSGAGVGLTASQGSVKRTLIRTRVGTTNKQWREQILNLENAGTPLSAVFDSIEDDAPLAGTWRFTLPSGRYKEIVGNYDVFMSSNDIGRIGPTMSTAKAINGASAKFFSMLRSEAQAISGPTFLGEFREALRMIKRPASALHSKAKGYLDALDKAKRTDPRTWMKRASGLWLEQAFGWTPLIADCKGAMDAYTRLGRPRVGRLFSVSFKDAEDRTGSLQSPWNSKTSAVLTGIPVYVWSYGKLLDDVIVRYKGRLKAQTSQAPFDNWNLFGFNPNEFLPTAWELLPWSFLYDYFTNIGDILRAAATVTDNVEVAWNNRTLRRQSRFIVTLKVDDQRTDQANIWPRTFGSCTGGSAKYVCKETNRGTLEGNSLPPLPQFQMNFNLGDGQLLNIAALLAQARGLAPQRPFTPWKYYGTRR